MQRTGSRRRGSMLVAAAIGLAGFGTTALLSSTVLQQGGGKEATPEPSRFDLKIREDFFAGLRGDKERLARAMNVAETAIARNPKHAQALVWHGSGLVSQAGQEFGAGKQQEGMKHWMQGLKEMEDAVKYEPNNIEVRIPRGLTLLISSRFVPEQMQKQLLTGAVTDLEKTYDLQKADLLRLGVHPRGELLFALSEASRRTGNEEKAVGYLRKIVDTCRDSEWAAEANKWLGDPKLTSHNCIGCHTTAKTEKPSK